MINKTDCKKMVARDILYIYVVYAHQIMSDSR